MLGLSPYDEELEEWNSGEVLDGESLEAQAEKWDIEDAFEGEDLGEADMELEDWKPDPVQVTHGGSDLQEMFHKWDLEEALDDEELGEADMELEDWKPEPIRAVTGRPDLQQMFRKWDLVEALGSEELEDDDDETLRVDVLDAEEEEGATLRDLTLSGDAFDYEKLKNDEASVSGFCIC